MGKQTGLWAVVTMSVFALLAGVGATPAYGQAATGGTITQDGSVWVHTFTSSGTFSITNAGGIANVEVLVVGGGGAGGGVRGSTGAAGGGGGGGDFVTNSFLFLAAQDIGVTVGAGGTGGTGRGGLGGDSLFDIELLSTTITALGGGGGGARNGSTAIAPTTGGSSGGASFNTTSPDGTGFNVNKGGNNAGGTRQGGAGGGGASTAGVNVSGNVGTDGGEGMVWYGVTYASGGGGGGSAQNPSAGGSGGTNAANGADGTDGHAKNGNDAPDNFGGGGGGSTGRTGANSSMDVSGGDGGSGIVIVRYEIPMIDMLVTQNDLPVLEDSTDILTDPSIFVGETTNRTYVVSNTGANTVELTGSPAVVLDGPGSALSITANIEGADKTLAPGESAEFTISFSSQAPGTFESTVLIAYEVAGQPKSYTFNVTATAAVWARIEGGDVINQYRDDEGVAWIAHVFTNTGPHSINVITEGMVECLVVAGGGAGGRVRGGGGGAGGFIEDFTFLPEGLNTVVVGAGGLGASGDGFGQNSTVGTLEAIGGGRGARYRGTSSLNEMGGDGGSGGGGGGGTSNQAIPGEGTPGQGYDGAAGPSANSSGAGGGGAGEAGKTVGQGSHGGAGLPSTFVDGEEQWFAGGGGGMKTSSPNATGGSGVGGQGASSLSDPDDSTSGLPNTGGGGGGANNHGSSVAGDGGSGIVVVRYKAPPAGTILSIK